MHYDWPTETKHHDRWVSPLFRLIYVLIGTAIIVEWLWSRLGLRSLSSPSLPRYGLSRSWHGRAGADLGMSSESSE